MEIPLNTENNTPNSVQGSIPALTPLAEQEEGINILDLVNMLLKRAWILILCFIVGYSAAKTGTTLFITPRYQATCTIYVYSKSTTLSTLADLALSDELSVDFQIVAKTREVLEKVIESQNLNMSTGALAGCVNITNPSGSHMMRVTATHTDPEMAAKISNAMANELRSRIAAVMNTEEPAMVERAIVPTYPSSPNASANAMAGGIGLMVIVGGIFVVIFLLDDTIKTEEDVKRYLHLNVLAEIPADRSKKSSKSTKSSKPAAKPAAAKAKKAE